MSMLGYTTYDRIKVCQLDLQQKDYLDTAIKLFTAIAD